MTVFLRDIQDLNKHILEVCALKIVDQLAAGCLDTDPRTFSAASRSTSLTCSPEFSRPTTWHGAETWWTPTNKAHVRYPKELGEQFVARANRQVLECLQKLEAGRQELAWLYQEICHYLGLSAEAPQTCGHQELLTQLGQRLQQSDGHSHPPLVLFGPPGIRKTL